MLKAFVFCIPTRGTKVPSAPDWLHEIKYDGYRLRVERNGDRVRLITKSQSRLLYAMAWAWPIWPPNEPAWPRSVLSST
jgi:bifunctional non-homologous end joining protein LigD